MGDSARVSEVVVPQGLYARLENTSTALYTLLVKGWACGGGVVFSELCRRCNRSGKTVRRAITEGRKRGWVTSYRDDAGGVRYVRTTPGPYRKVVVTDTIEPRKVAHKVMVLLQLNPAYAHARFALKVLHYSRAAILAAYAELRRANVFQELIARSLSAAPPKVSKRLSRDDLRKKYETWLMTGNGELEGLDLDTAAGIVLMHFKRLCSRIANTAVVVDSRKVADVKEVLRWISCDPTVELDPEDKRRLVRITGDKPYTTALSAVESLFTQYFSGFTYEFKVLFLNTTEKNYFERFVLGTYLKAHKDPTWRTPIVKALTANTSTNTDESYDAFKQRLLRGNS